MGYMFSRSVDVWKWIYLFFAPFTEHVTLSERENNVFLSSSARIHTTFFTFFKFLKSFLRWLWDNVIICYLKDHFLANQEISWWSCQIVCIFMCTSVCVCGIIFVGDCLCVCCRCGWMCGYNGVKLYMSAHGDAWEDQNEAFTLVTMATTQPCVGGSLMFKKGSSGGVGGGGSGHKQMYSTSRHITGLVQTLRKTFQILTKLGQWNRYLFISLLLFKVF